MAGENGEAGTEGDVVVEVTDEGAGTGTTTNGAAAGGVVEAPKVPLTEDAVAELQRNLEAEQRARRAAEDRASRAEAGQRSGQDEVRLHQLSVVNGALEVLGTKLGAAEVEYAEHMAAGDFAKAARVQRTMARLEAEALQLEQGKTVLEAPAPQRQQPSGGKTYDTMSASERVELIAAGVTPKSAAWFRAHPEYAHDPDLLEAAIGAHKLAVGRYKLVNESPEYFAFIEKTLGVGSTDARPQPTPLPTPTPGGGPLSAAAAPAPRDVQPPAAPASRGNGSSRVVKLTRDQVEAARISGLTPEEYAKQLVRTDLQGKTTH